MAKAFARVICSLVLCNWREALASCGDAQCANSGAISPERLVQSMLQTKRQTELLSAPEASANASVVAPDQSLTIQKAEGNGGGAVCLGSLATLDDEGYKTVRESGCQLEMDVFVRRVIDSLSLELCDEGGLLSLLPLYSSPATGANNFAALVRHIKEAAHPGACAFVAPEGSCPTTPRLAECMRDPGPQSHRRRQCKRSAEKSHAKPEVALIQAQAKETVDPCPLPKGAMWCQVHLKDLPSFWMAAYDRKYPNPDDVVSKWICVGGHWEEDDPAVFGPPGHMLDIGGHIGYHTFAMAQAGWTVTTFEPMIPNLSLMAATLCRNPQLASRIHVNWFGLGATSQQCKMVAPQENIGDGFTRCADQGTSAQPDEASFVDIGNFEIRRLDEVLLEQSIDKVDLVKIDVEGYEYQVFAGAPDFLTKYHPRVIKSEVWDNLVGNPEVTGVDYLNMFEGAGYRFFKDSKCETPVDAKSEVQKGGLDVFMCT